MADAAATELLCLGLLTLDIAARPIDALPQGEGTLLIEGVGMAPAGTAGGAAMVAGRLGLKVALAGVVGDDQTGRFVRFALEEQGVDTRLVTVRAGRTTSTTLLPIDSAGRRPIFHAPGAGGLAEVTEAVAGAATAARFLHYAGVGGPKLDGGPGAELLANARAAGVVVTCDLISPRVGALDELTRLLPNVDYFMPSVAEAYALTGAQTPAEAADAFLALGAGAVILKMGGEGSYAALPEGRRAIPAYDIRPVDTTSCGDSYCAGFIAGLARSMAPLDACRFATAVAAQVAQGLATLGALQSFEAALKAMDQMPLKDAA
jgi:sugar/nucleoside kinase (ribokinase family)